MASLVSRLWTKLCKRRPVMSIMIVGLDNSGKTSILNRLTSLNRLPPHSQEALVQRSNAGSRNQKSPQSDRPIDRAAQGPRQAGDHKDNQKQDVTPTIGYNYERIQYGGLTITALDFSGQNRYRNLWQEFYNCVDAIVFVVDSSDPIRLVVARDELETLLSHPYFGTLPMGDHDDNCGNPGSANTDPDRQPTLAPTGVQKQIILNQGKLVQSPLDQSSSSLLPPNYNNWTGSNNARPSKARLRVKVPILFLANKSDLANSVDVEIIVRALNLNQLPKSRHPWLIQATDVNSNQGIDMGFNWLVSQLSAEQPATATTIDTTTTRTTTLKPP